MHVSFVSGMSRSLCIAPRWSSTRLRSAWSSSCPCAAPSQLRAADGPIRALAWKDAISQNTQPAVAIARLNAASVRCESLRVTSKIIKLNARIVSGPQALVYALRIELAIECRLTVCGCRFVALRCCPMHVLWSVSGIRSIGAASAGRGTARAGSSRGCARTASNGRGRDRHRWRL